MYGMDYAAGQQSLLLQQLAQQSMPAAAPPADAGLQIDPVQLAIHEALEPVAHLDVTWPLTEMEQRIYKYIHKNTLKFAKDDRTLQHGTSIQAQALVEEFVENCMGSCSAACYDKAWFTEANFAGPLYAAALKAFGGSKVFSRVLAPSLQRFIEEALFRYRDEARIEKCFREGVSNVGLSESYHKKAFNQLCKSYDTAHMMAPYGRSKAESAGMRMIQDFLYGWMSDFMGSAWDLLNNGVGTERENQLIFVTALFQSLVGPEMRAMPYEIAGLFTTDSELPPPGWDFVAISAQTIWDEKCGPPPAKKGKKGHGKGWW